MGAGRNFFKNRLKNPRICMATMYFLRKIEAQNRIEIHEKFGKSLQKFYTRSKPKSTNISIENGRNDLKIAEI